MLSFDISAIDVVLLVTMLVLLLLFISQRRGQSTVGHRLYTDAQEKLPKKPVKTEKAVADSFEKQPTEGFKECAHQFGYLRNMPKNTPVPDECFGCPKVLRCMFPS